MAVKDTNPKDAVGIAKVPASTVPRQVIAEVGLAMMEGALKYGRHNYREAGVRASVYYDACTRHLDAFYEGQDIDPDSGLSHLVKAIACLVVLRDSQFRGNWVDDRPPKLPDNWQAELNTKAAALLEKYQDPPAAHVQKKPASGGVLPPLGPLTPPFMHATPGVVSSIQNSVLTELNAYVDRWLPDDERPDEVEVDALRNEQWTRAYEWEHRGMSYKWIRNGDEGTGWYAYGPKSNTTMYLASLNDRTYPYSGPFVRIP